LYMFAKAVQQFWEENRALWRLLQFDNDYDDSFYPTQNRPSRPSEASQITESADPEQNPTRSVDTYQNPVIVPEIQTLINQAARDRSEPENANNDNLLRSQEASVFGVPLEIAIMVVNTVFHDIYHRQASVDDLRNMLAA